jgi:hypothetical protein
MRGSLLRGVGAGAMGMLLSACVVDAPTCDHLSPQVVKRHVELEFQAQLKNSGQDSDRPMVWSPANLTYDSGDRPRWNVRWMERNDQGQLDEHTAHFYCDGNVVLLGESGPGSPTR